MLLRYWLYICLFSSIVGTRRPAVTWRYAQVAEVIRNNGQKCGNHETTRSKLVPIRDCNGRFCELPQSICQYNFEDDRFRCFHLSEECQELIGKSRAIEFMKLAKAKRHQEFVKAKRRRKRGKKTHRRVSGVSMERSESRPSRRPLSRGSGVSSQKASEKVSENTAAITSPVDMKWKDFFDDIPRLNNEKNLKGNRVISQPSRMLARMSGIPRKLQEFPRKLAQRPRISTEASINTPILAQPIPKPSEPWSKQKKSLAVQEIGQRSFHKELPNLPHIEKSEQAGGENVEIITSEQKERHIGNDDGVDLHGGCCTLAALDQCEKNRNFMLPLCQKSCGSRQCIVTTGLTNLEQCQITVNLSHCDRWLLSTKTKRLFSGKKTGDGNFGSLTFRERLLLNFQRRQFSRS